MKKLFSIILKSIVVISCLLFLISFFSPAFSATADTVQDSYDLPFAEFISITLALLFSALLGTVGWVVGKVSVLIKKYFHVTIDEKTRAYLEVALRQGILYAEKQARDKIQGIKLPKTKDARIAIAADYVIRRVPDAVNHFKLDRGNLVQMIESRLDDEDTEATEEAEDTGNA